MDAQAYDAFVRAGNRWSSVFTDPVTVNLRIGYSALASGVLAQASSTQTIVPYTNFVSALRADRTSSQDTTAVSNLSADLKFLTNRTSDSPNGPGSATPYLDDDGSFNNQYLRMTSANAKALGLMSATATGTDATITFSNAFSYDFKPWDGIVAGTFDFTGLASHEIGHALGFVSGVDILDYYAGHGGPYGEDNFLLDPLDLFRYSVDSAALGVADFTADARAKYLSLNDGRTLLDSLSTGVYYGDGRQDSHWKDNLGIGVMDPTAAAGELLKFGEADLRALDVVGWNRISATGSAASAPGSAGIAGTAAVPANAVDVDAPATLWLLGSAALLLLARRRTAGAG
ncbi:MAG: PEP-CTERM sorting domain-containing protein [Lysobacterales bacterium]|nr:MAG: PEP-CTERM sorting domain-containing protein [Xanthomonadales bacterium]